MSRSPLKILVVLVWLTLVPVCGFGQSSAPSPDEIRATVNDNLDAAISLYREFLTLPNDAVTTADIEPLLVWMEQAFGERGFATQRLETAGSPALFAQRQRAGAQRTILIYLQADGQPVDRSAWDQDDPYLPVLKAQNGDGDWESIPWASLQSEMLDEAAARAAVERLKLQGVESVAISTLFSFVNPAHELRLSGCGFFARMGGHTKPSHRSIAALIH